MTCAVVLSRFHGKTHHAIDWQESKATDLAVKKGRAIRIPIATSMAEAFKLDGVIAIYEAGKL